MKSLDFELDLILVALEGDPFQAAASIKKLLELAPPATAIQPLFRERILSIGLSTMFPETYGECYQLLSICEEKDFLEQLKQVALRGLDMRFEAELEKRGFKI